MSRVCGLASHALCGLRSEVREGPSYDLATGKRQKGAKEAIFDKLVVDDEMDELIPGDLHDHDDGGSHHVIDSCLWCKEQKESKDPRKEFSLGQESYCGKSFPFSFFTGWDASLFFAIRREVLREACRDQCHDPRDVPKETPQIIDEMIECSDPIALSICVYARRSYNFNVGVFRGVFAIFDESGPIGKRRRRSS